MQNNTDNQGSQQMRTFIDASDDYGQAINDVYLEFLAYERMARLHEEQAFDKLLEQEMLTEDCVVSNVRHPVMDELNDICDRLRAYMESAGGEYALGVETGMARAADMIENLMKRHGVTDLG